jgi:hypothetical protein
MSIGANKAVIRRFLEEVRNQGKDELVEELIDPAYRVDRPGLPPGVAGFRAMDAATRGAFPDAQWRLYTRYGLRQRHRKANEDRSQVLFRSSQPPAPGPCWREGHCAGSSTSVGGARRAAAATRSGTSGGP